MDYKFNNSKGEEVKVFLPKLELDNETMKQIKSLVENPTVTHPRFMPDTHKGRGCCVGLTSIIRNGLIPNYVGGDIGCGISCYSLGIEISEKKYPKVEKLIKDFVPMGTGIVHEEDISREEDWDNLFDKCNQQVENLYKLFPDYGKVVFDYEWYEQFSRKIKTNMDYDCKCLGTLGSGNHYVEININAENKCFVTVHSGSRNLGQKVCNYHQDIVHSNSKFDWDAFHKKANKIPKKVKGKQRKEEEDKIFNEMKSNLTVPYLENEKMYEYLIDMVFAQNYASLNRKIMVREIVEGLNLEYDQENVIETIHNYIDFDKMIMRKGAVSADTDEICIVSLNMRDGILLCKGKGNEDWNYSSAHGCGRILNRAQGAKLNLKEFQNEMKNVYSTSVNKETLDESPMAYRDVDLIKECLQDSVLIIEQLKPIINCKSN